VLGQCVAASAGVASATYAVSGPDLTPTAELMLEEHFGLSRPNWFPPDVYLGQ